MATQLYRLLPLLLFLPFILVRRGTSPPRQRAATGDAGLHPVVLLPGATCSQLEARLTDAYEPHSPQCATGKGNGRWFRLWKNSTAMQDPCAAPCLADQLRLVYDPATRDYHNVPGVETRVLGFGSTSGFLADNPADIDLCMGRLVEELERAGYRDGETLFGAPFDFRQAPAAPGQPCRAFSRFCRRLRMLIEHASRKNGGKPAVLVSHSQGGYFALELLNRNPLAWRRRHVKHFVMASTGAGGFLLSMQLLASKRNSPLSSASAFTALPSPKVFGRDTPLVVTRAKNYTAQDIPEFLTAIGLPPLAVRLYETRALPVTLNFRAPGVPTTCINGVGVSTMERLVYWNGEFSEAPEVVYGDGDGLISLASILALDTVIGEDPRQEYYKSVKITGTSHAGVISDAVALERVINEILEDAVV
ncbi:lecithin-cholesterol acyltransferase-like 1 [Phragmites australis]|uniref:lecithin-cholesterol acyltransferase-like 1 n=1 Tax=Phragmites australis TaxID=29695 RepID=UPI002D7748C8|nr:lecithin-cholesterol acyltransferase-like 1 [Phragmites australis]